MIHLSRKITILLANLAISIIFLSLFSCTNKKYERLFEFIEKTKLMDVHFHPAVGHIDYKIKDPYPTFEPVISRPFWPIKKDRIAVFDSMQAEALKKIYGYSREEVTENDLSELDKLSEKFWEKGKKEGFNRTLDISGIEKTFSNSSFPRKDLDTERVLWVPFVDFLFYPFEGSKLKSINPELEEGLNYYSKDVWKLLEKHKTDIQDLSSYLIFVDKILDDFKKNNAVALKVASAYIRTLWFDSPDEGEVLVVFKEGLKGELVSWKRYKKIQDFIARHILMRAGELKLPVHFHTGFGAVAGLKNLDSNPLNLESVFSDIRFKDTKFIMLHGGYPFWDKLKPVLEKRNAFLEFSAVNWIVFEDELEKILYEWLCYPGASDKIMFGSDAGAPVFFWIAARTSRNALRRALSQLIDKKIISEEKALRIAEKIMRGNAIRVHNLN